MSDTKMRNARERFTVSNYLVNNASLIHAIPTNTERARHVAEALGIEITVSRLVTAAVAAGLGLALGTGQPNVLALLHQCAPPGRGAEAIGIRATIGNASSAMLPLAFGAAGATLGLFAVFWGLGALIACGIPLAARKALKNNQHTQRK